MNEPQELYEQKIISDKEFPIQLFMNRIQNEGYYFTPHWHEHLELHYVISGHTKISLNHEKYSAAEGDLLIANSNIVHSGYCDGTRMEVLVFIFEMEALSEEFSRKNIVFEPLIHADSEISRMMKRIYEEYARKEIGYRLACKGMLMELLVYLSRHYVQEMLSDSDSMKRKKKLERLNVVNHYIEEHYTEPISNEELAELIHVSEDRFNHLFKEGMGMPPLQYINEIRLKKAMHLLKGGKHTFSEAAAAVGFTDYNHFGRMFRRYFGCTPREALRGEKE